MDEENSSDFTLYIHPYSFYSQKVMLALNEKKLPFHRHIIDVTRGKQFEQKYLDINPRGEVPVLKDRNKLVIDSKKIIDYLEENYSKEQHPSLTPVEPIQRQKNERFRKMVDKINGNVVVMGAIYNTEFVSNAKLPFVGPVPSVMKAGFEKTGDNLRAVAENKSDSVKEVLLKKADEFSKIHATVTSREKYEKLIGQVGQTLDVIEEQLKNGRQKPTDWLINKDFTTADVCLTTLLYCLDTVGLSHHLFPQDGRPQVYDYFLRVQERPSFSESFPSLMDHFKAFFGFHILGGVFLLVFLITFFSM